MASLRVWAIVLAGALALTALAAWRQPIVHIAVSAVIAALLGWLSITEARPLPSGTSSPGRIAGIHVSHAGAILLWVALTILLTYTLVLEWNEWWQFFGALAVLAPLVLLLGRTLVTDAAKGVDDAAMIILARFLAWLLTLGGAGAAIGLLADKKMTRFMSPRYTDWAANHAFFFGGIALAVLGWGILSATRKPKA